MIGNSMEALLNWLQNNTFVVLGVLGILLVLLAMQRMLRGVRRRRKPAELHPRLQAYAGTTEADLEAEKADAAGIVATSSTGIVTGYEIKRQIEAVFVEGYRTPNDAIRALKAQAARRGANAIIHLSQSRSGAGKCVAQGDAVVIKPVVSK